MRVRIETNHRQVQLDIKAKDGGLDVAIQKGTHKGSTQVQTWLGAEQIIVHTLRKLRLDELG